MTSLSWQSQSATCHATNSRPWNNPGSQLVNLRARWHSGGIGIRRILEHFLLGGLLGRGCSHAIDYALDAAVVGVAGEAESQHVVEFHAGLILGAFHRGIGIDVIRV